MATTNFKQDNPGCDCCEVTCWACATPLALVVDGADCCDGLDGTYLFGTGNSIPGSPVIPECGTDNTVSQTVIVVVPTGATQDGYGNRTCCFEVSTSNSFTCIEICDTKTVSTPYTHPILGPATLNGCHWLVLKSARIWCYVGDVLGVPMAFALVRHVYEWRSTKAQVANACIGDPTYEWVYEDEYEMEIDCEDATAALTHVSRSLVSATDASYTVADDSGFYWGSSAYTTPTPPSFRYNICAPVTLSLSF